MIKSALTTVILLLFLLSFPLYSYGAQTAEANATVTVKSSFALTLNTGSVDFGKVTPGSWKGNVPDGDGLILTCKSNNGNPWKVYLNMTGPFTYSTYTINTNLKCWGWKGTTASGDFKIATGDNIDTPINPPFLLYESSAAEKNNLPDGSALHLQFGMLIPESQVAGSYNTTIRVTMTE